MADTVASERFRYTCRMCRTVLFCTSDLLTHTPEGDRGRQFSKKKWNDTAQAGDPCSSFFIAEQLEWMHGGGTGHAPTKLLCPKCRARVGTFSWTGAQCSCGAWITPAIQVPKSKVDARPDSSHCKPSAPTAPPTAPLTQMHTPQEESQADIQLTSEADCSHGAGGGLEKVDDTSVSAIAAGLAVAASVSGSEAGMNTACTAQTMTNKQIGHDITAVAMAVAGDGDGNSNGGNMSTHQGTLLEQLIAGGMAHYPSEMAVLAGRAFVERRFVDLRKLLASHVEVCTPRAECSGVNEALSQLKASRLAMPNDVKLGDVSVVGADEAQVTYHFASKKGGDVVLADRFVVRRRAIASIVRTRIST